MNNLTPKQDKFARAYVATGGNGAKSARIAGYKSDGGKDAVMAHENLRKPNVKTAIEQLSEKALNASNLTEEDVKNMLLKEATDSNVQDGARIRAQELIGKTFGIFRDVQEHTEIEKLSDRELVIKHAREIGPMSAWEVSTGLHCCDFQMVAELRESSLHEAAQYMADTLEN